MSDVIKIVVTDAPVAKVVATQIPLQTAPTEAADMSATGATDGYALVADGAGGAGWEAVANSVAGRTGAVTLVSADIVDRVVTYDPSTLVDGKLPAYDEDNILNASEFHAVYSTTPLTRAEYGAVDISISNSGYTLAIQIDGNLSRNSSLEWPQGDGFFGLVSSCSGLIKSTDILGVVPLTGSQAITGALGLSGTGPINAQTDGYTLVAADNGKIVTLNKGTALTVTVPASLGAAFSCMLVQLGAGQVTVAANGTTINSYGTALKLAGQHAAATLVAYAADTFNLAGNLTA